MIETSRRSFITGLISLVAAPAIVRAGSLMPVKAEPMIGSDTLTVHRYAIIRTSIPAGSWRSLHDGISPAGHGFQTIMQTSMDGLVWKDAPHLPVRTQIGDKVTLDLNRLDEYPVARP